MIRVLYISLDRKKKNKDDVDGLSFLYPRSSGNLDPYGEPRESNRLASVEPKQGQCSAKKHLTTCCMDTATHCVPRDGV
jgi:hypothetical protein